MCLIIVINSSELAQTPASATLAKLGQDVILARDAHEALAIFQAEWTSACQLWMASQQPEVSVGFDPLLRTA